MMSRETEREKPNTASPQTIIRIISSESKARHFKCCCRRSTSLSAMLIGPQSDGRTACWSAAARKRARARCKSSKPPLRRLIDSSDQILDFVGVRAKFLGELVKIRIGDFLETGLVD